MRVLLDTNAYVHWKRGHDEMLNLVRRSRKVLFSAIVAGELLYGFRNGTRYDRNLRELEQFLSDPDVEFHRVGKVTADRYSRIVNQLRSIGRPIPTNDIWIAAQAMETGADLISFDQHFGFVAGLAWTCPK